MYGAKYFLASYVGYWQFPQVIEIVVKEASLSFVHRATKEILRTVEWDKLEDLTVETQQVRIPQVLELR